MQSVRIRNLYYATCRQFRLICVKLSIQITLHQCMQNACFTIVLKSKHQLAVEETCVGGGEAYLEREPRLATVGWQAGHSHSPVGMPYSAGRRQNRWKALLHSSHRMSFSSSPGSDNTYILAPRPSFNSACQSFCYHLPFLNGLTSVRSCAGKQVVLFICHGTAAGSPVGLRSWLLCM